MHIRQLVDQEPTRFLLSVVELRIFIHQKTSYICLNKFMQAHKDKE